MIDDDDVGFVAALWPDGGSGWLGAIIAFVGLVVVIALIVIAAMNQDECEKRSCPQGQKSMLIKHECLCVTEAK